MEIRANARSINQTCVILGDSMNPNVLIQVRGSDAHPDLGFQNGALWPLKRGRLVGGRFTDGPISAKKRRTNHLNHRQLADVRLTRAVEQEPMTQTVGRKSHVWFGDKNHFHPQEIRHMDAIAMDRALCCPRIALGYNLCTAYIFQSWSIWNAGNEPN
jgi:hypothetical protein